MTESKFQPLFVRSEDTKPKEREISLPNWKCFCCKDKGFIQPHLVRTLMPDWDFGTHKIPICQNCNAHHGWKHLDEYDVLDDRFNPGICKKLHYSEREAWRNSCKELFSRLLTQQRELAQLHNLRKRDRSTEEQTIAQRNHEEAVAWSNLTEAQRKAFKSEVTA
jgi:hypothetical protein